MEESDQNLLETTGQGPSGINIGGNTVTQCTEHLPEQQRLLLRWLHTHARENRWTWEDLVKAVAFSSTTWYRIWTDKFRYPKGEEKAGERMPIDKQCAAVGRYKKIVEQREAVAQAGFIETTVWKRVEWVCRRAFVRQKIGFIYGESQIGKSTCSREFGRRNNHGQTTVVELPPAAGVQLMTREIARALHVSAATCFEKLIEDCAAALDESKLLIVDEVHRVFTTYQKTSVMRCLDVLRWLHDKTRCGLVLIGTNVFRDELSRGQFSQYLKQLRRRGLIELQLPSVPPREDLDVMAKHFGLDPEQHDSFECEFMVEGKKKLVSVHSEEVMLRIAKSDGFGKYIIRLQDAAELAANKKQALSWEHFVKADHLIEAMAAREAQ